MAALRWLVAALVMACGARGSHPGTTFEGDLFCVPEARTVDLGAGRQRPPEDGVGQCKTWPDPKLIDAEVRSTCGVCGFVLDAGATRTTRNGGRPDACCYRVSSPPPPTPTPAR